MADTRTITVTVNGTTHTATIETRLTLVDFLRHELKLTGTHVGCEHGVCGACTVLVDGRPTRSCVTPIGTLGNAEIVTLEGLGTPDKPHALQKAFIDEQAAQCGYCVSGMIMSAKELLDRNPRANEADVRQALAGNLCRCGTHNRIIGAVMRAAREMGRT